MQTSLLDKWKNSDKGKSELTPVSKAPSGASIPLSSGQQRLWFLQQLFPESAFYNTSTAFKFRGELRTDILRESLDQVFKQNEILRSSYPQVGGAPVIQIEPNLSVEIKEFDLSGLPEKERHTRSYDLMSKQATAQFDLAIAPLFKLSLIKLSTTEHILFITAHHIIIDLWSIGILKEQLANNYMLISQGEPLKIESPEIQYTDYAYWQRQKPLDSLQLQYWKEKLSGELPVLNLPTDRKHPVTPSFKGNKLTQYFSKEFSANILNRAKEMEVTPFVLLFSAYYIFLKRHSGQNDIIVGTPISVRDEKSLENLIGFFIDTIVLRSNIDSGLSFTELVIQVRKNVLEAFSNKNVPFDELVRELNLDRSISTNPLFQVMFVFDPEPQAVSFGDELKVDRHTEFVSEVSKFDLTLFITQEKGILSTTFEYSTDLFNESTIIRFQEHLKSILEAVTGDPELKIKEIPVLTEQEKDFFLQSHSPVGNPFDGFNGIHELINKCAEENPNATAVIYEEEHISYGELQTRANTLVPLILKHTKGENKFVGLAVDRSFDMIVGMLAILNAGCAYMPIDPDYPDQRIDFMLSDAKVAVLLGQTKLKPKFEAFNGIFISIDGKSSEEFEANFQIPEPDETNLAYIIYTSGSSGKPKGVGITHKNIINSTEGRLNYYQNDPDVFLLMSSIAFDSSKAGIFWTLCTGGTLVVTAKHAEQDIEALVNTIESNGVSHTLMLPSLYNLLLEYADTKKLRSLTNIIVAGEACSSTLVKKHFETLPNLQLYNEYGPTEATVWCTAHKIVQENHEGTIPIGVPVANAKIYLLDDDLNLVPWGASGEICIGGPGLSNGYLNRPDLTEKAFIDNPFGKAPDEKLYKTGDKGRYNQNGVIEFLGRKDEQVKIRGFRIELDEVENAILDQKTVREVVVFVDESNSTKRLLAFVVPIGQFDAEQLKMDLKSVLPSYMIPSVITPVDAFPMLPNGKIDKKSLQGTSIPTVQNDTKKENPPRNDLERKLAEIWKGVLQVDSISINDNFFEIGGDSILSIQMLTKARQEKITLSPNQIFEYQTIRELAVFVEENQGQEEQWDYLVPFRKAGKKKPLFCLHAGGGHVFFYQGLVHHIDPERPLYAIQASGVYAQQGMHKTINEMAQDYIKVLKSVQSTGPYNVLVYCFSATVGHEIAMQLKNSNEECNLIVMDTMAKPWTLNTPKRLKIRLLGFYKRLLNKPFYTLNHMVSIRLNNLMSQAYKVLGNEEQKTLEELRSNLARLSQTYEWKPFNGRISLILTEKPHESLNRETIDSWKEYASGGIEILKTEGKHSFLFRPENLPHVAEKIEQCIPDD